MKIKENIKETAHVVIENLIADYNNMDPEVIDIMLKLVVSNDTDITTLFRIAEVLPQVVSEFEFSIKEDRELIKGFIEMNPLTYFYFNDNAIRKFPEIIDMVYKTVPVEIVHDISKENVVPDLIVLKFVKENPTIVKHLSDLTNIDIEVCKLFVEVNPYCYPYLSSYVKADQDVIDTALSAPVIVKPLADAVYNTIKHHTKKLNIKKLYDVAAKVPQIVDMLSDTYLSDRGIMTKIFSSNPFAFKYIPKKYQIADYYQDIILNTRPTLFIDKDFNHIKNKEFVRKLTRRLIDLVSSNIIEADLISAMKFNLPEELWNDKAFMLEIDHMASKK